MTNDSTLQTIRGAARPLTGFHSDFDPLLEMIGDAQFVLLGEASHGTHEFYRARAQITRRLIEENGFTSVAVEADWPDAYRVNCFVRGAQDEEANETFDPAAVVRALDGFNRFPSWMWRNTDVLHFVNWLRSLNQRVDEDQQCGFYGLDLYSLHASMEAVLHYLEDTDPEAAARARERYACFERFERDSHAYGHAVASGESDPCENAAVQQLIELQARAAELTQSDGPLAEDRQFFAEQNARLVKNAEEYYRSMYRGRVSSWNLRDRHMAETLDELVTHLEKRGTPAKVVVWAHNSHLGDARATEMGRYGELNVGQLVREAYGRKAVLVGFTCYEGEVTAASDWDKPPERKRVRPALSGSHEQIFHAAGIPNFLLNLRNENVARLLQEPKLERAIGVVYRPETERASHYFEATLPQQFDAVLHYDVTHAVEPLERNARWDRGEGQGSGLPEFPETYPTGI